MMFFFWNILNLRRRHWVDLTHYPWPIDLITSINWTRLDIFCPPIFYSQYLACTVSFSVEIGCFLWCYNNNCSFCLLFGGNLKNYKEIADFIWFLLYNFKHSYFAALEWRIVASANQLTNISWHSVLSDRS